ncbi:MAG: prepilin peptidase [Kiloniellales bacterium]|nr:prepilin peptidase [Kiloniellales bacterium]MDJ0969945.1 prepilin peptidase [Kiloniellales bacterium]MDJ0981933.1 prepilin peptidase [Kiloniellales bacterium]
MSIATHIPQFAILVFAVLVIWAAVTDVRSFTIPNRICVAIGLLYPAYVIAAPQSVDWVGALIVAGATLAVGFVMFLVSYRGSPLMGAGDTKLLTVCALWAGPSKVLDLLIIMAMAGGVIAVFTWVRHRPATTVSGIGATANGVMTLLRIPFLRLPYGLAICAGALYVAISLLLGV